MVYRHDVLTPIWQEIVIGVIALAIVSFVLMSFVFPRMEKTFASRQDAIEGGLKRAEASQAEANVLMEQHRAQLAEARTEAAQIRDQARADAETIRQDALATARHQADRIVAAPMAGVACGWRPLSTAGAGRRVGPGLLDRA